MNEETSRNVIAPDTDPAKVTDTIKSTYDYQAHKHDFFFRAIFVLE